MRKNILILDIDTSDSKKIIINLIKEKEKFQMVRFVDTWISQMILPIIEDVLRKHNTKLSELTGIKVNTGPGSFTGIRVGMAVANTLGWLLDIPVNGKTGIVVDAVYK